MKKILMMEDEEILRDLLKRKLTEKGYQVKIAVDGQDGIEKLEEEIPDLILLDIVMPKKSGFEILEELGKDSRFSEIPVIIVSNSGQPVEIDRAQKLGAKDWLIKTEFDPEEVIEKVVAQIGQPE